MNISVRSVARCCLVAGSSVVALCGLSLLAQSSVSTTSPVHWSTGGTVPVVVHAGTLFQASLFATIDPCWHLYASRQPVGGPMPMVISIAKEDSTELFRVAEPHPWDWTDPQFGLKTAYFEKAAKFTLYLRTAPVQDKVVQTLHMYARYQACNDRLCLPPQEAVVVLNYQVRP